MVIKPILRPGKTKDEKRIAISIHDGGKNPTIKLIRGRKINKRDWNNQGNEDRKNWIRSTCANFKQINEEISNMLQIIRAEKNGEKPLDLTIGKKNQHKFLEYAKNYSSLIRKSSTRVNIEQGITKLETYLVELDKLSLYFNEITKHFCKAYYNWLRDKYPASSTNQFFGVFRTIYKDAENDDSNSIAPTNDPFQNFKYDKNTTKNSPLTTYEFIQFLLFPPSSRKQLQAKNIWLFQFSQAFRIKDVILLKWKNLKYTKEDGRFILDLHTSKTSTRVVRTLSIPVTHLLSPSIFRYFPNVIDDIYFIQENIDYWENELEKLNEEIPFEITPESLLDSLSGGITNEELKAKVLSTKWHQEEENEAKRELENYQYRMKVLLGECIIELNDKYGEDFVWDKPQNEKINIKSLDNKNSKAFASYKRCIASNNGYLKRIAQMQGIKSKLSSHTARHTASNFMIDSGINMNKVSQVLTHSNYKTTELYFDRLGLNVEDATEMLSKKLINYNF